MKRIYAFIVVVFLFAACTMHAVKYPMAGSWYTTIEDVDVLLELTFVDGTVTGGLKLLEDADHDLPKGSVVQIIEGSYKEETARFYLDVDLDGKKSDEDIYMELHLEDKETLMGFGHEVDGPDDKRELSFRRTQ